MTTPAFILNGSLVDANLLGTGQRIAVEANAGKYAQVYSFSHTRPYVTVDGLTMRNAASGGS